MRGCGVWCGREDESVSGGGIGMGGCAMVYKAVCVLVVRDLRSGDDSDHLGGARNQDRLDVSATRISPCAVSHL